MSTINKKKAAVMAVLDIALAIMFAGPIALDSHSHHASSQEMVTVAWMTVFK